MTTDENKEVTADAGEPTKPEHRLNWLTTSCFFLVKKRGKVFSIDQIYEKIWNEDALCGIIPLVVHICRYICEKIEINPERASLLKGSLGSRADKIEKQ